MAGKGALILVIGFGVIMGYIITNLTSMGTRAVENMSWYNSATASKNLANIGTHAGFARLRQDLSWRGVAQQTIDDGAYSGGSFTVSVSNQASARVLLRSVSQMPLSRFQTIRDTVEVLMYAPGESEYKMYGWIANVPGNAQFFNGNDIIWGPIHANGGIHLGNIPGGQEVPIFHGKVTSGQNIQPVGGIRAKFLGGYETSQSFVDVPTHFDELITAASTGGLTYGEDIRIQLAGTAVNVWLGTSTGEPDEVIQLDDPSFNGSIYSTGKVQVEGVLDGMLSIGAAQNLEIVDNVTYHAGGADKPYITNNIGIVDGIMRQEHAGVGEDLLGLYAGNDIVIVDKGNAQDFTVHGILLALNEVKAQNYNSRTLATLDTWGAIIMHNRGDIRHAAGTHGFIQNYRYDTRLEEASFRPLNFPGMVTKFFDMLSWWESLQIPPF